jgi:hypothetical protein
MRIQNPHGHPEALEEPGRDHAHRAGPDDEHVRGSCEVVLRGAMVHVHERTRCHGVGAGRSWPRCPVRGQRVGIGTLLLATWLG